MTAEEPDPQKELLYEKLSVLPEEDQDLYRLYYTEGYSQVKKNLGMNSRNRQRNKTFPPRDIENES